MLDFNFSMWTVCGNWLIVLSDGPRLNTLSIEERQKLAAICCGDRRCLSADNVIVLELAPDSFGDPLVTILEPSGQRASLCGNGLGCAAAHLGELSNQQQVRIQLRVATEDSNYNTHLAVATRGRDDSWDFTVDLGVEFNGIPDYICKGSPDSRSVLNLTELSSQSSDALRAYFTVLGEPHTVLIHAVAHTWEALGDVPPWFVEVTTAPTDLFPKRTNVMFATLPCDGVVYYRSLERSGRETLSCGSGVGAIVAVYCSIGVWERAKTLKFVGSGVRNALASADSHLAQSAEYSGSGVLVHSMARRFNSGRLRYSANFWDIL